MVDGGVAGQPIPLPRERLWMDNLQRLPSLRPPGAPCTRLTARATSCPNNLKVCLGDMHEPRGYTVACGAYGRAPWCGLPLLAGN